MSSPRSLNRAQLSEFCGVSLVTIDNWVRDGCPYVRRPVRQGVGQWEFSASAVFQWRIDRERQAVLGDVVTIDENEARRRKLAAEAGLTELELHIANGKVVKIEDASRPWFQMVGAARAKLLSLPNKLGPVLAIETDPLICQSLVEAGINEALSELSGYEPTAAEPEAEELSDDTVDARLAGAAAVITRIRNSAASGGVKQLAVIITECDRARSEIFGVQVEPRGTGKPPRGHKKGSVDLGAAAEADHQRVGRQGKKAKSRVK